MGKMDPAIKRARELKKLAEATGLNLEELSKPVADTGEELSNQAEAVLAFYETRGKGFRNVVCKKCGRAFYTDYGHVSYCSNNCRRLSLEAIGIQWDPTKTEMDRWTKIVPLIVPPAAVPVVEELAISNLETIPESLPDPDTLVDPMPGIDSEEFLRLLLES